MKNTSKSSRGKNTRNYEAPFAKRLQDLIEKRNTIKQALAEHLSISQQAVSLYTSGNTQPTVENLVKIARFFNVSTDYLLGLSNIASTDITTQSMSRYTGLEEQSIEVLRLYGETTAQNTAWNKFFEDFGTSDEPLPQTGAELELKTLNHIIANCNALLRMIGLYWFGDFTGLESLKVEGMAIGSDNLKEVVRNAMLQTITNTLVSYRELLADNGGDLLLSLVLDKTREDKREQFVQSRVEFLESVRGRSLTDKEIQEQRDLYEQPHNNA